MATLLFQAAGAAVGGIFGPLGAVLGRAAGALAGNALDRALLSGTSTVSGARLSTARLPGASEGTAIPRVYGTTRIGGTLIWATRFEEEATTERTGGKAGGTRVKTYRYFANIAVGLCEGPVAGVRRVWADGQELDLGEVEMRVHTGSMTQLPDPLIEAKQDEGRAPAYRGLAYVVFERLPLDDFGNRIPLLQFEVMRPVGTLERQIRAVNVIPGATEHGYAGVAVRETTGEGSARILNRNTLTAETDWKASIDELQALCPNLESVALVVTWFGTDLRAGECRVVPGVEVAARSGESRPWRVAGIGRSAAHVVSLHDGGPAYGGTPSDESVVEAIRDLAARGLKVTLYPLMMMDIPAGSGLPDPHGGAEQAAYPWRGRITCPPATDRTAAARTAVEAFCGAATAADFTVSGDSVTWHGADEGYRRMVLHCALLAKAAGGVDAFLIGSELKGLTTIRDETDAFPFVGALAVLAGDVRAILGPATKITYGADWSEYSGYHPADGSGDHFFHLDPLWASPEIDAVGIDNYMPLSDWRDEDLAAENPDGFRLAADAEAMARQIAGGEGYDWYYASAADRAARLRTPITDGAAAKPWVFRVKDIEGWWSNRHFDRVAGVEKSVPTAWTPAAKPVWFTELGCPAIDRGANQPNVFGDPKSAEGGLPYHSRGLRADAVQRRFLSAHYDHWGDTAAPAGMVDPARIYLWAWDARPYPAFPGNLSLWSDGGNWRTGHWLNGRLGAGTLADVIGAICGDHGFAGYDVSAVTGDLAGYVQADVASARSLIEPLAEAFRIDVIEDGGVLRFRSRDEASLPAMRVDVLADLDDEPLWRERRGHDSDFAGEAILTFYDAAADYAEASARSRRAPAATSRVLSLDLSAALAEETALAAAEALLRQHRAERRSLETAFGPNALAFMPGDVLTLADGPEGRFVISECEDGAARRLTLSELADGGLSVPVAVGPGRDVSNPASDGFAPAVEFLDLPRYAAGHDEDFARVAAFARPWRRIAISSSVENEGYALRVVLDRPATLGRLAEALEPGVTGRFDCAHAITLDLAYGSFASASTLAVLNGTNRLAVRSASGVWEVIGFAGAEEIAPGRWRLTRLLRGLGGSEDAMAAGAPVGARVVALDAAVPPVGLASDEAGRPLNYIAEAVGMAAAPAGPFSFAGGRRALTPLAPVHLAGRRLAGGGIEITWVRRGRIDADDWEAAEIPLDEAEERYRLEILAGSAVRRTVETVAPGHLYAAADEIADFGGPVASLAVRVRQRGRRVVDGIAAEAVLSL